MPNVLGTRPILVDTAAATILFTDWIKINNIVWDGYSDQTHDFTITDAAGHVVLTSNGTTDLAPVEHTALGWVHGLAVTVLDSGKLYIYTD